MSDTIDKKDENLADGEEKKFCVDRAKSGRAKCKKCKQNIDSGSLRLAKFATNPFSTGKMKVWHHVGCLFEVFKRQRPTTAKIEQIDDIDGWENITPEDQQEILSYLSEDAKLKHESTKNSSSKNTTSKVTQKKTKKSESISSQRQHKDNSFRQFRKICAEIAGESSYTKKTGVLKKFFTTGSDGDKFKGDLKLWCKLLLPAVANRVYNLQSKQLIKLFSKRNQDLKRLFKNISDLKTSQDSITKYDQDAMLEDLENGDIGETVQIFFEKSSKCKPNNSSVLSLYDVETFLDQLSELTREEDQLLHFSTICNKCTSNDLKMIVRLIKHDLRINAGPKHILDAIDSNAYQSFQASRNLDRVVEQVLSHSSDDGNSKNAVAISISLLTPVLPMLAQACKSLEYAVKKCPEGMYAEVKYDGERVQIHKSGHEFKFFSRSLKPVIPHKVDVFKEFIPKAFTQNENLILDAEVLMIEKGTGTPLPFGSLGKYKKNQFKDATPCLFVFDCLYFDNNSLINKTVKERKQILHDNMNEIPNHVKLSEVEELHTVEELEDMLTRVLRQGLEGLVLKPFSSMYEPGKRHWFKLKKDYLFEGALADTADLVVLGAWYGTGSKGGMMSVFLMGCYNPDEDNWCTVTKVHGGHDDKTLNKLQDELDVIKISKDVTKVPKWLKCNNTMVPDFVAHDPKNMPVWEIAGAEFTQHDVHTANGISIRFPRVTRIRVDKTWDTATSLPELMVIYENSKDYVNFDLHSKKSSGTCSQSSSENSSKLSKYKSEELLEPSPKKQKKLHAENTVSKKKWKTSPLRPLPNIFDGVRLVFPEDKVSSEIYRYFIAYGGMALKLTDAVKATHSIPEINGSNQNQDINVVPVDWIWNSIRLKKLEDDSLYKV